MSSSIHSSTSGSPSTQRAIETIRDIASNIRQVSFKMREVVRAVHQSGAIDELATSVHEAMIAARDTTKEICETSKDLRERGVIRETATNVEETAASAREIGETAKHTAQQVGKSTPHISEALRKATNNAKSKRKSNNR